MTSEVDPHTLMFIHGLKQLRQKSQADNMAFTALTLFIIQHIIYIYFFLYIGLVNEGYKMFPNNIDAGLITAWGIK